MRSRNRQNSVRHETLSCVSSDASFLSLADLVFLHLHCLSVEPPARDYVALTCDGFGDLSVGLGRESEE